MHARFQRSRSYYVRIGALLAGIFTPVAGMAQQPEPQPLSPVQIEAQRVSDRIVLADKLDIEANALYGTPKRYFEAGVLHRRAALLRGIDTTAVASYRAAAWAFSAAGAHSHARVMMERAADRAADVGDVERAANCFIDAALLAVADGREDRLPMLLGRMHAVLTSPLLPADRRSGILERVGISPTLALVDANIRAPQR